MSNEKDFLVHIPLELVKGDDGEEWRVRGIASTGDADLQGESIDQDGLDISALQAGKGVFNFDHQKGPENVLGIIEDAKFINHEGKKCLWVEGYLFKEQERSKAFRNILKSLKKGSSPRVHMSIEGKILNRDLTNPTKIKQARIDKVALTLDPVNPYTFAELCKSLTSESLVQTQEPVAQKEVTATENQSEEMVQIAKADLDILLDFCRKALSAGAGNMKNPEARTGGEATTRESMDSKVKSVTYSNNAQKKKKNKKGLVKSLIDSLVAAHPNHNPLELAEWAIEAFLEDNEGESGD